MKKTLGLALACVMVMQIFTPVFALTKQELLDKLDDISADVASMQAEYEAILSTYSDVIDSLSAENKEKALSLDKNLLADDIKATVNSIKSELASSTVENADKVLDAINNLETKGNDLIDDNRDVLEEVKSGYGDLSIEEIQEVTEKVKDIVSDLGVNVDTTDSYNETMTILNNAHAMALNINTKIDAVLSNNVDTISSGITVDAMKDMVEAVKNKDRDAVIDILKQVLDNAQGGDTAIDDLKEIKADAKTLKAELEKLNTVDEKDILLFTDEQVDGIKAKIAAVETDYINFAKSILTNHVDNYMHIVFDVAIDEDVDDLIEYANKLLDYVQEYKSTVKDILKKKDSSFIPESIKEKAALVVALGYIDIDKYDLDYIDTNFSNEIHARVESFADEVLDYLDTLDVIMQEEVLDEIEDNKASVAQTNVKTINSGRFTTVKNLKSLKARVESEILDKIEEKIAEAANVKSKLNKAAPYAYNIFYSNILNGIEKIMGLEKETAYTYEYNQARNYIISDGFFMPSTFASKIGIPSEYEDVLEFSLLTNSKIKTGSTLLINLSEENQGAYKFAVLGDVYADGKINSQDYMAIKNQIMEKDDLSMICKEAADTYRDSKINSQDYMKIKNYIMKDQQITFKGGN